MLLLDDVMSELDGSRRENLSENMKNAQTVITGVERYAPPGVGGGVGGGAAAAAALNTRCFRIACGNISKD